MTLLSVAQLILLLGAVLSLALRTNRLRAVASLLSQGVATALVLWRAIPVLLGAGHLHATIRWSYPIESITAHLDPLGAFFLVWSLPMTALGTVYATGYLRPYPSRNAGVQFALLNLTSFSFVMIYTLESAMAFLLGWEMAAVSAWLLVIWDYRNQKIRFAGFNYLVSTQVGFFLLVAAFMTMHSQTTSMDFGAFAKFLRAPTPLRNVTFLLLVTCFGLKSAFFPFHTWLPRAHAAAPAHVSALMSGVIHKAGLFGLLRFTLLMGTPESWMGWYLVAFSSLSALMGALYATTQRDLKRLLGYSSTENVGIAGIGFGVGYLGLCWHQPALVVLGFSGGLLHILNHAFVKCLLFYGAGAVHFAAHTVDIERLGGLIRKMPWTAAFFLLGCLAIAGLPPLNGFVGEFVIYRGLLTPGAPSGIERALLVGTAATLALVGGVSVLASVRAFAVPFLGHPRDAGISAEREPPLSMRFAMAVHAAGAVVLGLVPAIGLRAVREPVALFGAGTVPSLCPLKALLAFLRWRLVRNRAVQHVTWACGYPQPNARMQYTGASFSAQFAWFFDSVLHFAKREKLPATPFPEEDGHLFVHNVDTVERRIFEAIGQGEEVTAKVVPRLSEEPRFAFGLGLVVLLIAVAAVLGR